MVNIEIDHEMCVTFLPLFSETTKPS